MNKTNVEKSWTTEAHWQPTDSRSKLKVNHVYVDLYMSLFNFSVPCIADSYTVQVEFERG